MKKFYIYLLWICFAIPVTAQAQSDSLKFEKGKPNKADDDNKSVTRGAFKQFVSFYPVNTDPYIAWKSSMNDRETILFEASPEVRINIDNNILSGLGDYKKHVRAYYIHFGVQLRMFVENSYPVKTASTPILIGTQHSWVVNKYKDDVLDDEKRGLFTISFETGHYSNGQKMGAFTDKYEDGSEESEAIYDTFTPQTDLSALLNRNSGNFSTNLTELKFNYRANKLDGNYVPIRTHSYTIGGTYYHNKLWYLFNIGGFSTNDINIYGRLRLHGSYEYINYFTLFNRNIRYSLSENIERIFNAHPFVQPMRFDTSLKMYPFAKIRDVGILIGHTWGHDKYNYRFVDSGHQFTLGFTFSVFPPFAIYEPQK